jgi:hypothetical protein
LVTVAMSSPLNVTLQRSIAPLAVDAVPSHPGYDRHAAPSAVLPPCTSGDGHRPRPRRNRISVPDEQRVRNRRCGGGAARPECHRYAIGNSPRVAERCRSLLACPLC